MTSSTSKPRFTIIIPTKDRADYLFHTLRTCSNQEYENLEIIVSDDGSSDHTEAVVREASRKDPRITYTSPRKMGMRENFEHALDQVKPGYVIALGGDDAILPYGISKMWEILEATKKDILTWRPLMFAYPAVRSGRGQLGLFRPGKTRLINSKDYLARQASELHYINDETSPMFYIKGVVSTHLIDRVRSRTPDGRFYVCPTPDGFSGVVLAGEVEDYVFSGIPLSMGGASPTSQGMAYLAESEEGKKLSDHFYNTVAEIPMHQSLASQPYSPLISVMTADYLLTARDLPGWPGRFPPIDYKNLILKGLHELKDGLYAEDRVDRELNILYQIAKYHGLESHFLSRIEGMRRHRSRKPFVGNGITPNQLLLDCSQFHISNIFDAAYVAFYFYQFYAHTSIRTLTKGFVNSLSYKFLQLQKGRKFPSFEDWSGGS